MGCIKMMNCILGKARGLFSGNIPLDPWKVPLARENSLCSISRQVGWVKGLTIWHRKMFNLHEDFSLTCLLSSNIFDNISPCKHNFVGHRGALVRALDSSAHDHKVVGTSHDSSSLC